MGGVVFGLIAAGGERSCLVLVVPHYEPKSGSVAMMAVVRALKPGTASLLSVLALAGCSISANPYAVHPDTIVALRSHTGKSVKLAPFTSDKPGKSEIMCRAVGMIQTPAGVPFERYVEDALRTELAVAGLLADHAPVTITGHLERMHFSTAERSSWELRLALASSNGRQITVAEDYAFNWHFLGDYACREAATAMAPAVQALVRKAVRHPEFPALLDAGQSQSKPASTAASAPAVTPPPALPIVAPALTRPALPDLREWAPGKWRSTGGTNSLVIERDLRWFWESSSGGKWSGTGSAEIEDGQLLLRGWHSSSAPMSFRLRREGDMLVGELQTARSYRIIFERE